ncbi:MAG: hypothetical protein JSW64_12995 [Candidatus Zixiibacteriota bacterium]|nr:MAG: hypothetical protein JSW64_12995 [candidate division Zixibacteria bacterium]
MQKILNVIIEKWDILVVVVGGAVGLWRFLATRKSELAWKRTEFIFDKARYLDTDPDIREIIMVLESETPSYFAGKDILLDGKDGIDLISEPDLQVYQDTHSVTLEDILIPSDTLDVTERRRYLFALNKFLNFFDRLHYAVCVSKALRLDEIWIFGWYLQAVLENELLNRYCLASGYANVVELAENLMKLVPENEYCERDTVVIQPDDENKERI